MFCIGILLIHNLSPWKYLHFQSFGMVLILLQNATQWMMQLKLYSKFLLIVMLSLTCPYSVNHGETLNHALFRYAQRRGVNVLAEIDVPGHARSWYFYFLLCILQDNYTSSLQVHVNIF